MHTLPLNQIVAKTMASYFSRFGPNNTVILIAVLGGDCPATHPHPMQNGSKCCDQPNAIVSGWCDGQPINWGVHKRCCPTAVNCPKGEKPCGAP